MYGRAESRKGVEWERKEREEEREMKREAVKKERRGQEKKEKSTIRKSIRRQEYHHVSASQGYRFSMLRLPHLSHLH